MSINKNDCMDCACLEIGNIINEDNVVSRIFLCTKTGSILDTGLYLDAMEEDCELFEYGE